MKKVAIHGVPRSGTSWVGAIFDSSPNIAYRHQPLFSYAFKSYLNESSSKSDIERFFNMLLETDDDFVLQKNEKEAGVIPTFRKNEISHVFYKEARYHNIVENILQKDEQVKIVGIVRNPKSVISSWYNAPKEFEKNKWSLMQEWEDANLKNEGRPEEFYGYNKWKEVAILFLELKEKYPKRFYLLRYEDLLTETTDEVKQLFKFCDIKFSTQTATFIEASQHTDLSKNAYSVFRKNQDNQKWKDVLPEEIVTKIDNDLEGTKLKQFNQE